MQHIMISGSNRGIGLAITTEYLSRNDVHVFATCRNPNSATDLQSLKSNYPDSLTIVSLDIDDTESINRAVEQVSAKTQKLDLLINNAGIYPKTPQNVVFGQLDREALNRVMATNSVSPVIVTQAFVDLLTQGDNPRVVMISSKMGSISQAGANGFSYRMSKTALNMAAKILSLELASAGITVVTTHPGHVATDMGGSSAPVKPIESASGLIKIADNLSPEQSGKFYNYTGEEIPW